MRSLFSSSVEAGCRVLAWFERVRQQAPRTKRSPVGRISARARIAAQCGVLKAKIGSLRAILCAGAHLASLLGALVLATGVNAQHFRLNEDVISNPTTGAAIDGHDPIAYFVDGQPRAGSVRLQANAMGKVWYFTSMANLAEFEARPHVYVPVFGGHDPVAVARGVAVAGNPDIHAIHAGRLYLFRSVENREQFLVLPQLRVEAERNWPEVRLNLTP